MKLRRGVFPLMQGDLAHGLARSPCMKLIFRKSFMQGDLAIFRTLRPFSGQVVELPDLTNELNSITPAVLGRWPGTRPRPRGVPVSSQLGDWITLW